MKISHFNNPNYRNNEKRQVPFNKSIPVTQPSFGNLWPQLFKPKEEFQDTFVMNHSKNYEEAKKYVNSYQYGRYPHQLKDLDLKKLEGIQEGIEVFDGLSLKEIRFLSTNLTHILVNRGCHSKCSSCGVDATPQHFKDGDSTINKMSWEDFTSLTKGLKELEKRIKTPIRTSNYENKYDELTDFTTPFLDSDCIEIEVKDKNNKTYDFTDVSEELYKATEQPILFDTSGWAPRNTKLQGRAENFVKYVQNNPEKIGQINISINPFHGLNNRAIKELVNKNPEAAKKFRDLYTERMANAIFTFTPILKETAFIETAMANHKETPYGYSEYDLIDLLDEIEAKVKNKYIKDLKTEKKYIKDHGQIATNMEKLERKFADIRIISPVGRAKELYGPQLSELAERGRIAKVNNKLNPGRNPMKQLTQSEKIVDANGKIYCRVDSAFTIVPTDLQLNFKNKHKDTVPLSNLYKAFSATKEMINSAD